MCVGCCCEVAVPWLVLEVTEVLGCPQCVTVEFDTRTWYDSAWRLVQVLKAGESADRNSRVCHAVLKVRKAGCSEQSRLQPPLRKCSLITMCLEIGYR